MITLYDYKEHIINYYVHEMDNSDDKINQRCFELLRKYNERYLQKIVDDTYEFVDNLPINDILEKGYYECDLDSNTISYISLSLNSGGVADTIYNTSNGKLISKYILKTILGNNLHINIKSEEINIDDEDADYKDSLYIQGFIKESKDEQMKLVYKR